MINSQDIKKGTCIRLDGKLYFCVDFLHAKPGKGNTIMRTTLKDVVKGGQIERRFKLSVKSWKDGTRRNVAHTNIHIRKVNTITS